MLTKIHSFLFISIVMIYTACSGNHGQRTDTSEPINMSKSIDYQLYKLNIKYNQQGQEQCEKYIQLTTDSTGGLNYYGPNFQNLISYLLQQQHIDIPQKSQQPTHFFHLIYKPDKQADSLSHYTIAQDIAHHYGYRITDSIINNNVYMLSLQNKTNFIAKHLINNNKKSTIDITDDRFTMTNISLQTMAKTLSEYYNKDFAIATPDTTLYTLHLALPLDVSAFCTALEQKGFIVEMTNKKKKVFRLELE